MTRYVIATCPCCGLPFEVPAIADANVIPKRCHYCRNRCLRGGPCGLRHGLTALKVPLQTEREEEKT